MKNWRRAGALLAVFGLACALAAACGEPPEPERPPVPTDGDGGPPAPPPSVDDCTDQPDGTLCQGAKVCIRGVCNDPICGDGVVTAPEECDHGTANAPGAGCELDCTWSCAPEDPARDCSSGNPCMGPGTCDPERRTCTPGAPLAAGTSCGEDKTCVGGACIPRTCGDAVTTPPEQCDNGDANGPGTGCEVDCTLSCSNAAADCAPVPCNTMSCSAEHRCQATPDASKNGEACDAAKGYVCSNGACVAPGAVCGNGVKEDGEDCDFGAGNAKGSGCEPGCKFSCTVGVPGSCVDSSACRASPTCTEVTAANGGTGYKCVAGATKADGATCGSGAICLTGACAPSVCGDGFRDPTRGEQCDDGNTRNLDACDATCQFEQVHRVIALKLESGTGEGCAKNAIGGAIGRNARSTFQRSIDDSIKDGSCSALFKLGSNDLSGQSGPVTIGSLSGAPSTTAGYDGTSDLDWWYVADPLTYDGAHDATATLTGSYAAGALDASGSANLTLNVGGSVALLRLSSVRMRGAVGAPPTTPTVAAANAPPGHVAREQLDPALKSFATLGGSRTSPTASLCGNISAASLATMPVAAALAKGGATACTQGYTAANSMLDVFVNGCKAKILGPIAIDAIIATQPDFPESGDARRYTLAVDPSTKRVNKCTDEVDKKEVNLSTCLSEAAFSSYFKFATDRVIIKQ